MYQQNFNKGVRKSLKVDPYVNYRANMEKGKKLVKMGAIFFMAAAILYLCEQLLAFRKRMRRKVVSNAPPSSKRHLVGIPPPADPIEKMRSRSLVGLVQKGATRARAAVKSTVAAVTSARSKGDDATASINDAERLEGDGIMKADSSYKAPQPSIENNSTIATNDVAAFTQDNLGSYDEPDLMKPMNSTEQLGKTVTQSSSEESAVKVDVPNEEEEEETKPPSGGGMRKIFGRKKK
jgi:hypothetical protein